MKSILAVLICVILLSASTGCEPAAKNPNARFTIIVASDWRSGSCDCYRYDREGDTYTMYDMNEHVR